METRLEDFNLDKLKNSPGVQLVVLRNEDDMEDGAAYDIVTEWVVFNQERGYIYFTTEGDSEVRFLHTRDEDLKLLVTYEKKKLLSIKNGMLQLHNEQVEKQPKYLKDCTLYGSLENGVITDLWLEKGLTDNLY